MLYNYVMNVLYSKSTLVSNQFQVTPVVLFVSLSFLVTSTGCEKTPPIGHLSRLFHTRMLHHPVFHCNTWWWTNDITHDVILCSQVPKREAMNEITIATSAFPRGPRLLVYTSWPAAIISQKRVVHKDLPYLTHKNQLECCIFHIS